MPIYKSLLPAEYQEVEYIESSGTQYIDTGVISNNNTKVSISLVDNSFVAYENYFGDDNYIRFQRHTYNNVLACNFGLNQYANISYTFESGVKYNVELDKNNLKINNLVVQNINYSGIFESNVNSIYLFTAYNNSSQTFRTYSIYKLYSCKIYDNGTLVRNFVPCYRKSDSVIGLFDTVNKVFYTNQGTGTFLKGNDVKPRPVKSIYKGSTKIIKRYKGTDVIYRGLPSAYQEVEYIESSGTQYIDTRFTPDQDTSIELKVEIHGNNFVFGSRTSLSVNTYGLAVSEVGAIIRSDYDGQNYTINTTKRLFKYKEDKNLCYIDDVLIHTHTYAQFTCPYNLVLFGCNNNGTILYGNHDIYSCQIYDNNTLVRDYVPCYRKSDNTIGLYDLVNGVFYTNAGTGTFLKGGNV